MATRVKNDWITEFRSQLSELAANWYENDEPGAFRHLAFQTLAPDPTLSDEQVIQMTAIDKSGDLEVDGWLVDETSETIFLFQAFGGESRVEEGKVAKFVEAPHELLNPERVDESPNQAVKELSKELNAKLQNDYSISLVFASKGGFAASASQFAASRRDRELPIRLLNGEHTVCRCSLSLLDEDAIAKSFEDYRAGFRGGSTNVGLQLREESAYVISESDIKSIRSTVDASEIVRVFNEQGFRLFSLNPRGPIANAKTNKDINKTLDDETGRKTFHLLNNGLCATCEDFELHDGRLDIVNFQIVNGCQTTVTLSKRSEKELSETLVDLKLVVAEVELAERIASSSNSQTALKAKDYTSFERQQRLLNYDFGQLQPPWFYEIKQGYWRYVLTDQEKARFKTGQRKRHIEVQPLAQASLAFQGNPAVALDRVRFVFQGIRSEEDREWYDKAFPQSIKAQQLILPWVTLQHLLKQEPSLRFSNFHILWQIAQTLREHYDVGATQYFSSDLSRRLSSSINDWFPGMFRIADNACEYGFQRAQNIAIEELEVRDFFRASGELSKGLTPMELIDRARAEELKIASDRSDDPRDKLP